ncbi:MAG TPA: MFS transporter [Solirubrobacterales bacterium]|nr:MFS transporter [Solirubrobacterales bacterium]
MGVVPCAPRETLVLLLPVASSEGTTSLWRNRDFTLLESGRLLSMVGSQSTTIAYTLLTLELTGSAAKAGLVTFAQILPFALFGLLGGMAADRRDRKPLMITADFLQAFLLAALAAATLLDAVEFWQILVVAAIQGACSAFYSPAASGALRSVVPPEQLPAAAGVQQARGATVGLVGPPLGGALFGLGRALPFVFDAISFGTSTLSLLAMRTPFQDEREVDKTPLSKQLSDGFKFLWNEPFLRTTTFLYGLSNFIGPGLLLALVVIGDDQGLGGGTIGLLVAAFGGATLVGALLSPLARRTFSSRTILLLELWSWVGCAAFVVWPNVYVLAAALVITGLAIPVTDSVVVGYRLAITPDHIVGRVEGVRSSIALIVAPLGPLLAGLLLAAGSERLAIAVFAFFGLVLAVWGVLAPAIREIGPLSDLRDLAG